MLTNSTDLWGYARGAFVNSNRTNRFPIKDDRKSSHPVIIIVGATQ